MTAATFHEPAGRHQSKVAAASGWIGSALEYYDFFIYATAASLVFPQEFFPSSNPDRRDHRIARHLWRRLRRQTDRRLRSRPSRRHARAQERAARLPVPDGPFDHGGRRAAHLRPSRRMGADPAGRAPPASGLRGRRRNLRRKLDDPRARAVSDGAATSPASRCRACRPDRFSPPRSTCR